MKLTLKISLLLALVISSFFILAFTLIGAWQSKKTPEIVNGIIDLRGWDFKRDGPVRLDGIWNFYWGRLIGFKDLNSVNQSNGSNAMEVPGLWHSSYFLEERPLETGFATYHLKVLLDHIPENPAIKLMGISTAARLSVNDQLVKEIGKVGESKSSVVAKIHPEVVPFKVVDDSLDIFLQVSNFTGSKGGIWDPLSLGDYDDLSRIRTTQVGLDFFVFGSIFMMGLYNIFLFLIGRQDRAHLYLGFACFLVSSYSLLTDEIYFVTLFPQLSIETFGKVFMITGLLGALCFSVYLSLVFQREYSRIVLRVIQVVYFALALLVFLTRFSFYTHFLSAVNVIFILTGLYALYCIFMAWRNGNEEAPFFVMGFSIFVCAVANDAAKLLGFGFTTGYTLVSYALLMLVFFQSLHLSRRFFKAFHSVNLLSNELAKKNQELLRLDGLKDDFLSNTSHELRTPIHGIMGLAESMLLNRKVPLKKEIKSNLAMIIHSGRSLTRLISDILDFSKLKHDDLRINTRPIDIRQIAGVVVRVLSPLALSKGVTLNQSIPQDLPLVNADEDRVVQIFNNLIGNAIKFTDKGEVVIRAEETGGFLSISVADTGIGIRQEDQASIFESFRQLAPSIQRKAGGTGLGLSIARNLVRLHGGELNVVSNLGEGSTFYFTLPISSGKSISTKESLSLSRARMEMDYPVSPAGDSDAKAFPKNKQSNTKSRVLVVDDDEINIRIVASYLSSQHYEVLTAESAASALLLIEKNGIPDIVLLDIMMPGMSGFELCERIRQEYSSFECPVIFLTAKEQVSDLEKAFQYGGNDYLTKPFTAGELIARVQNQLLLSGAGKKLESLRLLAERLGHLKDSEDIITITFQEITHVLPYEACWLIGATRIIQSLSNEESPENKSLNPDVSFDGLFNVAAKELTVVESLNRNQKIYEPLQRLTGKQIEGSSWLIVRIEGFDEYLICFHLKNVSSEIHPAVLEFLKNVIKEVKTVRSGLRKQALDVKSNVKYIEVAKSLEKILYIKGGGGGPYCTAAFDPEEKETETYRVSLQNLQTYFPDETLLRVHHSYLINTKHINLRAQSVISVNGRSFNINLLDSSGTPFTLPVSKKYCTRLKESHPDWF